jgi:hypothetical protein
VDACGAPVLRDQGPERPAGHGKADANLDQLTSCSQNQIRQDCYLAWVNLGSLMVALPAEDGRRPPSGPAATRRSRGAGLTLTFKGEPQQSRLRQRRELVGNRERGQD